MTSPILVTGGAGYIGSHICKMLAERGTLPVCLDTLEKGNAWAVKWGPLVKGDIGDRNCLADLFEKYRFKAIIHLAGYIEVGESVLQPERYLANNTTKSLLLLKEAIRHQVQDFIFSSTCAVYGEPITALLAECHRVQPLNPYADSKALVEAALLQAAETSPLRAVSLRYFNASGADRSAEIGEAHIPETHLVPLAIDAALGVRPPLTLFGDDFDTPDGSCIRDFVHVSDLSAAHLCALDWIQRRSQKGQFHSFNIGSGSGYSVFEVLKRIEDVSRSRVPFSIGKRRPGDSSRLVADIGKAQQNLAWAPCRNLDQQLEDALRWRRLMHRTT